MWIVYTAVYIFIGRLNKDILVSSISILFGGILVFAVFAHILIESDHQRARSTLLVALAASIFFMKESIDVYNDYLAAVFSLIFGIQFLVLILVDQGVCRSFLKYKFFSTMSLVLVASSFLLPVTIYIKYIIEKLGLPQGYYLAGPIGTGAFAGLAIGGVVGVRLLPRHLPDIKIAIIRKRPILFLEASVYAFLTAYLAYVFNYHRFICLFHAQYISLLVSLLYTITMIFVPCIAYRDILKSQYPVDSIRSFTKIFLACFSAALLNTLIVDVSAYFTSHQSYSYISRFIHVEAPIFITLAVSLIVWQILIRKICRSIVTDTPATL